MFERLLELRLLIMDDFKFRLIPLTTVFIIFRAYALLKCGPQSPPGLESSDGSESL